MSSKRILKNLPSTLRFIRDEAQHCAGKSTMLYRHGAVMFPRNTRKIISKSSNYSGSRVGKYDVPCIHAEGGCLLYFTLKRNRQWCFKEGFEKKYPTRYICCQDWGYGWFKKF